MMKKISAVIFDCDGVLFDSRQANTNFYNRLLSDFGLPLMTEEEISYVHMHTACESVQYIFRNYPFKEAAQKQRLKMDYSPFIKDMIIEPGLKKLLKILKPGFALAIATNRSNTIGEVLEYNGLAEFFEVVISSLDVQRPKPNPESLFKILDFFKISPDESIYIGDSVVDYETADAADVPFISYKNRQLKAAYHLDCLMDIVDIINS